MNIKKLLTLIKSKRQKSDVEKQDAKLDYLIDIYKQLKEPLQKDLLEQSENILKLQNKNLYDVNGKKIYINSPFFF